MAFSSDCTLSRPHHDHEAGNILHQQPDQQSALSNQADVIRQIFNDRYTWIKHHKKDTVMYWLSDRDVLYINSESDCVYSYLIPNDVPLPAIHLSVPIRYQVYPSFTVSS